MMPERRTSTKSDSLLRRTLPPVVANITSSVSQVASSSGSSGYVEQIIYDLITSGRYRGHLKRLTGRIEEATHQAFDILQQIGLPVFGQPRGGFYMWCGLPDHVNDTQLSRVAAEQSILLAPGSAFHPDASPAPSSMRVNIAHVGDPRFRDFIAEHCV